MAPLLSSPPPTKPTKGAKKMKQTKWAKRHDTSLIIKKDRIHEIEKKRSTTAPFLSSPPPSKPTKGVKIIKQTKSVKRNETSLTIKKDGIICWDGFTNELALKDDSPTHLNALLTEMGVKNLSVGEQTKLIRKYNFCVGKLTVKNGYNPPKLQDVLQLMKEWTPKTDLIKLHVRWARKSPQNFHLDSLSTLLTVSNQVDYLPHLFLLKAKTLVVFPRSSRFTYGKFGVRFEFKTVSSKDVDSEKISRQFAGLALTLSMLQSAVIGRRGTIGKVGMRQSAARTPSLISFVDNDDSEETPRGFLGIPLMEFHKESSLHKRLWLNINHRWMALQLVVLLFKPHIEPWVPRDALEYTFRMHSAGGTTRHDFLNPMVGFCLRFSDTKGIKASTQCLQRFWNDVNLFSSDGNQALRDMSEENKRDEIFLTFVELQDLSGKSTYSSHRLDDDKRWLMLRGFIYHYWLESTTNQDLLASVVDSLKKRRSHLNLQPHDLPPVSKSMRKKARVQSSIEPLSAEHGEHLVSRRTVIRNRESSGYVSLLSSRKIPSESLNITTAIDK
jgi:hypothetical protein